jgi:hypothetical protein
LFSSTWACPSPSLAVSAAELHEDAQASRAMQNIEASKIRLVVRIAGSA